MKFVTAHVMGGLGNQLFQIFAALNVSLKYKMPFYFEESEYDRTPGMTARPYYWKTFLKSLSSFVKPPLKQLVYREQSHKFSEIQGKNFPDENIKLYGYFQSYKYFQENQEKIYRLIKLFEHQSSVKEKFSNGFFVDCVSMHFRIGDYKHIQQHHPIQTVDYYKTALSQLIKDTKKDDWKVCLFYELKDKNDVYEIREKLTSKFKNVKFVDIDHQMADWEQMIAMSLCQHNIIANSTFSWWGAYLNQGNNNVYYPSKWFGRGKGSLNEELSDLFPSKWKKVFLVNLIQFSPVRSGSTLIYNYLLELGKNPLKYHSYFKNNNNYYIITIRHPYNSIILSILRYGESINCETIEKHIKEYFENGGDSIINHDFTGDNHCVLIYENFVHNHDNILNELELFFGEKYRTEDRNRIKEKLDIKNVKNRISRNGYKSFSQYDTKTHFHGKHISEYNGNTDYTKILKDEHLKILKTNKKLNIIIEKYYKV